MVRFKLTVLVIAFSYSCSIPVAKHRNETILKSPHYKLDSFNPINFTTLIDTSGIYIHMDTEAGLVYQCLHFQSNGSFVEVLKFDELFLTDRDFQVHPNSIRRGRYSIQGNNIDVEMFYPGEPSPFRSGWYRSVHGGKIYGDTIQLKLFENTLCFIKSKNWYFESGELVNKKNGVTVMPKLNKSESDWWK